MHKLCILFLFTSVQSTAYCKYHRGQFTSDELLKKALDKFRSHKVVVISGPRYSGKTSLALKILSSYQEGHYLILTEPEDLAYIRFGMTCVVVIEDLGGKLEVEKSVVQKWFRKFDMLQAAVKDGKLNVIVTCDFDRLSSAIPAAYRHPLLQPFVTIPTLHAVKVKEEQTTDELAESQGTYRRKAFSTARTDSKELSVPDGDEYETIYMSCFSQFRNGSFLAMASQYHSLEFIHFSSDMEYSRRYTVYEDTFYGVESVCCIDTGVVLFNSRNEVRWYKFSYESYTLELLKCLQEETIIHVCSNMNEIYLFCADKLFVLNEKGEARRRIEHFLIENNEDTFSNVVFLRERLFHIDGHRDSILIEDTKVMEIKYLKKEGFQPQYLCAANDTSVFVLGKQGRDDSRILQVDTKRNVLSDITISSKRYSWGSSMIFDRANARLIIFYHGNCELIYLK